MGSEMCIRDRPQWFAKLDERTKTPKNAILFVMLISLTAPWFGREVLCWVVDMSSIGAAIGYGYTSLATYKTHKQTPADSRPVLKVMSLIGAFFAIIFVILLVVPGMPSYLAVQSRVCLVIWILLGVIFYFATRNKEKR